MAFSHSSTGLSVVSHFSEQALGKIFLITGCSPGGLGAEAALSLCSARPSLLILSGRPTSPSVARGVASRNVRVEYVPVDLADQASVRAAVPSISSLTARIDVLINNAAVMASRTMRVTPQGVEEQFGINHLGHFLLTNLLLKEGVKLGRVVNVTSTAFTLSPVRFGDINFRDGKEYHPWKGYGQSKSANVLFTKALAHRGVAAYAVHPGVQPTRLARNTTQEDFIEAWKLATEVNGGVEPPREKGKTVQQGCSTILLAALDPGLKGCEGSYLRDCRIWEGENEEEPLSEHAKDPVLAERLWEESEELLSEKFSVGESLINA